MNEQQELLGKIRQQFDTGPYPRKPLELSPKKNYGVLFDCNLVTPFYLRNQKIINTKDKLILDAGCGSGYKALALAEANPGAKIIGVDISLESVKLAAHRLSVHGIKDFEIYDIGIEELPELGLKFDYINMDEVLYLLPDPLAGLQALQAVLKPEGIIRTNLHSYYQRFNFYQAQRLFKTMGLMDENPGQMEMEIVRELIASLKDNVLLKSRTWLANPQEKSEEWLLCNYLLQGDKGFTIPEMFALLESSGLELISMVNWRQWEILNLFKDAENLPAFLAMSLAEISLEERLHLFELLNPIHRLLDFWCGHKNTDVNVVPVSQWSRENWQKARAYLHPQLANEDVKKELLEAIASRSVFEISRYIRQTTLSPLNIESSMASCLLPLWEGSLAVEDLVERFKKLMPVNLVTLEPVSDNQAWAQMTAFLTELETFMYVLLECC